MNSAQKWIVYANILQLNGGAKKCLEQFQHNSIVEIFLRGQCLWDELFIRWLLWQTESRRSWEVECTHSRRKKTTNPHNIYGRWYWVNLRRGIVYLVVVFCLLWFSVALISYEMMMSCSFFSAAVAVVTRAHTPHISKICITRWWWCF